MNTDENQSDTLSTEPQVIVGGQKQAVFRSKKWAILFAVTFAVIGSIFLLRSFAASPDTLFKSTSYPAVSDASDSQSTELGVKFKSDVAGTISGIRFYKGTTNTGVHIGDLWTASGTKLASATFTNETASGWQEVDFATPVPIQANTTYVASYFAPNGGYAYTYNGFANQLDAAPLHALADGASGPNGVYIYSNTPAFPANGYRASNYWVDVMFEPTATSSTPPKVTITSPSNDAKVSGIVTIAGTASDSVSVASMQLSVDGGATTPLQIAPGAQTSWSYKLDTSKLAQGTHTIKVAATDSSGLTTNATLTFTVSTPTSLTVDTQVATHQTKPDTSIATPAFSTNYSNELLTAFITSDGPAGSGTQSFTHVTGGGLTWTLKARANTQSGTSEIWQAVAPSPLTNATITATRASGSYVGSFVLTTFVNASTNAAEPTAVANAASGAPSVSLAAPVGSWTWAAGNDYDRSQARTAGANQTIADQYLASTVGDTYWVQHLTAPATSTATASINDTKPSNDRWNLAAIAILPSTASSTGGGTTDTTPPTAPSNVAATAKSDTQVDLSWTASTDPDSPVAAYTIYRNGTRAGSTTTTSFVDQNLSPNTTYSYYITASDPSGNVSSPSSTVSVLTSAAPDTTPPTVPTGLQAVAASATQVNLSWTASTDPASSVSNYLVLRNSVVIATVAAPVTTFSDTSVTANTSYSYEVEAQDLPGNTSAPSTAVTIKTPNPVDTTPPTVPTNVAAVAISGTQVNLSWMASTDNIGVGGYTVYRNGAKLGTTTTTSYGDATVTAGTTYSYTVSAYDGAGNQSAQSAAVSVTTPGAVSGGLPTGVGLQSIDGGPAYFSQWSNSFSSDSSFVPIGVYPAEGQPAVLSNEGINFYTPSRNDNNGTWCPTWSNPNGNDMTAVNAASGFYAGGTFYQTVNGQAWGSHAAFDVFGDELDGNAGNFFDCLPTNITSNNKAGSWGGLSAASFEAAEAASKSDDPTRPTYIQTTTTFIDGNQNYFYTEAEKQAICSGADIFSFDIYPIVLRGGNVWDMYDQVQEARGYCRDSRPVMAFTEMDHMNGGNVYPLPAQTTAEVWNAIIAGARGVQYFDQYGTIDNTTYTGGGHYAAGAMYNAVKTTNAEVDALAPVINSPFATGYVTSNGTMSIMVKYYDNHFYIFAIPHASGAQTITFKLAGSPNTTATVLNENRTLNVSNGSFTDTFANENTVHIYEIN